MADILESAQKQIDEAAKQATPATPATATGIPAMSPPPVPPPEPAPTPLVQPPPTTVTPPVVNPPPAPVVAPPVVKPPEHTMPVAGEPTPPISVSPPKDSVVVPPIKKDSPKSSKPKLAVIIGTLLLLIITLPIGVYFISQRNGQLTDSRSRAAGPCSPNGDSHCGTDGFYVCENFSWQNKGWQGSCQPGGSGGGGTNPQPTSPPAGGGGGGTIEGQSCSPAKAVTCSNGKKHFCNDNGKWSAPGDACQGSATCNTTGYACSGTQCMAKGSMKNDGTCGDVPANEFSCQPTCNGAPSGGGSCTGYTFDGAAGRCNAADANKCRTYSECCAPGKSRIIKSTCLASGQEQFDVTSSCNDAGSSVCGTATSPGPVTALCKPGEFYWPKPDGDDKCHDISAPPNPGGGTANCTPGTGCSNTGTQCIKRWTCTQAELSPQGFCLKNMAGAEFGKSYQAEADSTCKYIQVDVYNQNKCSNITSTTGHDGTIIYKPVNPNGCGPAYSYGQGSYTPGVTNTPVVAQCNDIRVYDSTDKDITASLVAKTSAIKAGDKIKIGIKGANAVKGRFRVNGAPTNYQETSVKNAGGEFTADFTIPAGTANFTIEAQVTNNGTAWN